MVGKEAAVYALYNLTDNNADNQEAIAKEEGAPAALVALLSEGSADGKESVARLHRIPDPHSVPTNRAGGEPREKPSRLQLSAALRRRAHTICDGAIINRWYRHAYSSHQLDVGTQRPLTVTMPPFAGIRRAQLDLHSRPARTDR